MAIAPCVQLGGCTMGIATDEDADLRPDRPYTLNDPLDDCERLLAAGTPSGPQDAGDQFAGRPFEDEQW